MGGPPSKPPPGARASALALALLTATCCLHRMPCSVPKASIFLSLFHALLTYFNSSLTQTLQAKPALPHTQAL